MKKLFNLDRNIYAAGIVSLFMDISSEMIYPLVPLFLASVLGVNKSVIGVIEGVAESTASILKVFSGWFSDRVQNRKWMMFGGYGISVLSRPIMALSGTWHQVLGARFIDRLGKGVRTAPRDAIIAESTETQVMARAFSLHRAMDTVGAVIGPATAFFLLEKFSNNFRLVFWASVIPGALALVCIVWFIRETKKQAAPKDRPKLSIGQFSRRFKAFILIIAIFSVGNSSDAFLILRAQQEGIREATIPIVYLMFNLIYSLSAVPAGMFADRFGKRRVIFLAFLLFSALYFGFARAKGPSTIWMMFALYGIFMGLTEGVQKGYLATIIPKDYKATAFGIYNMAVGIALLPASVIGGWLWDHVSPAATFYYGSATALFAALLFLVFIITSKKIT